jgi:hypothetical protein
MSQFNYDFEETVVVKSRLQRLKDRLKDIYNRTTKLLQRRDIPETAKDEIREIRKIVDKEDTE